MTNKELSAWWKAMEKGFPWEPKDKPYLDAIHRLIEHGPEVDRVTVDHWVAELENPTNEGTRAQLYRILREIPVRVKEIK